MDLFGLVLFWLGATLFCVGYWVRVKSDKPKDRDYALVAMMVGFLLDLDVFFLWPR